jgi:hypothetical protein
MGYGPNCKRCSTGLQWIRILNSSSERMAWFNQVRTRSRRKRRSRKPRARAAPHTRTASRIWSRARNVSRQTRILPCVHSLPVLNARVVHSVLHRNIPGHTRVFHRPVPDICTGNPQASPPSHPPVFHKFSTDCRPTRPQANSRPRGPWPGAPGAPPVRSGRCAYHPKAMKCRMIPPKPA